MARFDPGITNRVTAQSPAGLDAAFAPTLSATVVLSALI